MLHCSVTGATIVNDTQDLREEDVGTNADLFEIKKIGDEYYTYVTSEKATAVTVVLRGPSKVMLRRKKFKVEISVVEKRGIVCVS